MHERTDSNIRENGVPEDPVNTLGYLKTFFTWMPVISEALELDAGKREKWLDIAEHLAEYPRGTIREIRDNPTLWTEADVELEDLLPEELMDTQIYYDEGVGGKWSFHFPGNVMQIYPGSAIGLGSDPKELEIARNTVHIHALVENALASLLSNGHASTIGLQSTSIRPLPTAYTITLRIIPTNGSGKRSGRKARPTNPAAEHTSEVTIQIRYPILSTNFAQNRSTNSCVRKKQVEINAIFPSVI